jgi:S1-C subfamily serine protease
MKTEGRSRPRTRRPLGPLALAALVLALSAAPGFAFEARVLDSVVSVLPLWPGEKLGGTPGTPPGSAPEATAVAVLPGGLLATALHVVDRAEEITVRLADGRRVGAELVAGDRASDIALLRIPIDLPALEIAPEPALGAPVCAVGNAFGLDLSVTCGVVSATRRSGVGFNPVEDFIQTDASVNPGAVSSALLMRVVEDLAAHGQVLRPRSGFRVEDLNPAQASQDVGVRVVAVTPGGAGEAAGLAEGDLVTAIAGRRMRNASDATAAIQLQRPGDRIALQVLRAGALETLALALPP